MTRAKMTREDFDRLMSAIRGYDFFPQYIESYRQQVEAERRNEKCLAEYCEILAKYGIEDYGISPDDFNVANLDKALRRWLGKRGVEVELAEKEAGKEAEKEAEEKAPARRIWTEDEIRVLVQTNDKVLYGALRKLYAEQTADEQDAGETTHRNGVGFNGVDAKIMSSFAEFLNRTGFLTPKQRAVARRKLVKYNRQLTRLANA